MVEHLLLFWEQKFGIIRFLDGLHAGFEGN